MGLRPGGTLWRPFLPSGSRMNRKQVGAWALFDFANSIYPAVIQTAVFCILSCVYIALHTAEPEH